MQCMKRHICRLGIGDVLWRCILKDQSCMCVYSDWIWIGYVSDMDMDMDAPNCTGTAVDSCLHCVVFVTKYKDPV